MPAAKPTHDDIYRALKDISDRLGHVSDDGKTGTGLVGRVMRVEYRVSAYDRLKERAVGAAAAGSVAIVALWFLVKAKIAAFFGTAP